MVLDVTGDPRDRPKYFGVAGAMLGMAFMLGPALGAGVAAGVGKRAALFSPMVLAAVMLCVGVFVIKETRADGGVCGKRPAAVDTAFDQGAAKFAAFLRSKGGGAAAAGPPGKGSPGNGNGDAGKTLKPALPTKVYACFGIMCLAAFSFTAMTSMTAL